MKKVSEKKLQQYRDKGYTITEPPTEGEGFLAIGVSGDFLRFKDKTGNDNPPFLVMQVDDPNPETGAPENYYRDDATEVIPLGPVEFKAGWTDTIDCGAIVGGAYRVWVVVRGPVAWK